MTLVGRYLRSVRTGLGGLLFVALGLLGCFMPPKCKRCRLVPDEWEDADLTVCKACAAQARGR